MCFKTFLNICVTLDSPPFMAFITLLCNNMIMTLIIALSFIKKLWIHVKSFALLLFDITFCHQCTLTKVEKKEHKEPWTNGPGYSSGNHNYLNLIGRMWRVYHSLFETLRNRRHEIGLNEGIRYRFCGDLTETTHYTMNTHYVCCRTLTAQCSQTLGYPFPNDLGIKAIRILKSKK